MLCICVHMIQMYVCCVCMNDIRPGVKPDTVMYGRDLPEIFFQYCDMDFPPVPSPPSKGGTVQSADTSTTATETEADEVADLLLVVGTSLTVSPANSLVHLVNITHCIVMHQRNMFFPDSF